MRIPKTTKDKPYIEFRFDKKGKMTLTATSSWWGGKNAGFFSSDGSEGNTAPPKQLDKYIKVFKTRKIKETEKEILTLCDKLRKLKEQYK